MNLMAFLGGLGVIVYCVYFVTEAIGDVATAIREQTEAIRERHDKVPTSTDPNDPF